MRSSRWVKRKSNDEGKVFPLDVKVPADRILFGKITPALRSKIDGEEFLIMREEVKSSESSRRSKHRGLAARFEGEI